MLIMLDDMISNAKPLGWNYIFPNLLPAIIWIVNIEIFLFLFYKSLFISLNQLTKDYSYAILIVSALVISVFVWASAFAPRYLNPFLIDRFWKIKPEELSQDMKRMDISNRIILSTSLFNLSFPLLILSILSMLTGNCIYTDCGLFLLPFSIIAFISSIYYSREIFIIIKSKQLLP